MKPEINTATAETVQTGSDQAVAPSTPFSPRELAEKIATRLYTDGQKTLGTRLEIRLRNTGENAGRDNEKPLGGWCFSAAVDQIATILEENS